ncbi:hypothetical protein [Picrophilus oshimae]|uniref:Uncharacterized protein n=1 Tax=Picrophilus torridus (strain ATCC 700027 / DSM 9790 / JCM 10055 / NBRC 100828 / KAW 2/3) TaxID=1122961 RepID=Q6KZ26_PICTO|nr:hypothetical protein [Picrophilus oshimae]AAT44026.1 hypothetical protein PTO1441 [Picrophilus oshimae DSM 9789]
MTVRELIYNMMYKKSYNEIASSVINKFGINIDVLNELKMFPNISRALAIEVFYLYNKLNDNEKNVIIDYSKNNQIFADALGECINSHGNIKDFYEIIAKNKCIRSKIDNIDSIYYNKDQ